jgi:hypothetical protein
MVVDTLQVRPGDAPTLAWRGRATDAPDDAVDGWSTDRTGLLRRLDRAGGLVVLDAMSFPWESLRDQDRDLPITVVLPTQLDATALDEVLGTPLARHLTPFDRLVDDRAEVRRELTARWHVAEDMWLDKPEATDPDAMARARKAVWRQVREAVAGCVRDVRERDGIDLHHTGVVCADPLLAVALEADLDTPVTPVPLDSDALPDPLEHIAVLVLPPALAGAERVDLITRAHRRLRGGGSFIVVATVVALPGDRPGAVPSMDDLVEDLQRGTGQGLHVHEIRSLRWADEPVLRGVLVAGTSLSAPVEL